jgi:gliding motility-associated-like protein
MRSTILLVLSTLFVHFFSHGQIHVMNSANHNTTVTSCGQLIVDNGGLNGDYSNNQNYTRTFCSADGGPIRLNLLRLNIENGYDFIRFYDGPTTASPLMATLTGFGFVNDNPGWVFTSTGSCITINFTSDASWTYENWLYWGGFQIAIGCEPQPCNGNLPASDFCGTATSICTLDGYCGSTSGWYTIDNQSIDNYVGNGEFCGSIENNSWLSFEASSSDVFLDVSVTNCILNEGVQMVLLEGDCSNLTRVGTNCISPLIGDVTASFSGLNPGETYFLMVDGFAGDYCNYEIAAISGVQVVEIQDNNGNVGSANVCASECLTLSVNSSEPPTSYNWYSIPAGVSGTGSTVEVCPSQDMVVYVDITGACGDLTTAQFEVNFQEIEFTPLPATINCNDAPINLFAEPEITPCLYLVVTSNGQNSPAQTVTLLENGVNYWTTNSLSTTAGTVHTFTYYQVSPSANLTLQLVGNTASDMSFTVYDCSDNSVIYTGVWNDCGTSSCTQTVNLPSPGVPNGIANWSSSCGGLTNVTDWGSATFNPSLVAGPLPTTCDISYIWDNENGCSGTGTQTITVLSPFNATFNYSNIIYCSTDANQTPNITGDSGGIFSASPAGLSINSTTGVVNIGASSPGLYSISYTVGTAPCVAETSVDFEIIQAPNAGSNGSHTMCSSDGTVNLFSYLNGTPMTTGTWSGPSVLTNGHLGTFNPLTMTPGVYTYTVSGVAPCSDASAQVTISVNPEPNAGSNGAHTLCSSDAAVNLFSYLGGTPMTTGTWSGPSVLTNGHLGTFDPSTMTAGVYTYTVAGVAPCADDEAEVTISVNTSPNAGTNGSHTLCSTDAAVNLFSYLGGTPMTTGTWSGPSVLANGHLGTFDPSTMTAGVYTYTVAGVAPCADDEAEVTIIVNPTPLAPLAGTNATYCQGDVIANLTATAGSGGTLTWYDNVTLTDVVGTGATFTPSSAVGTHTYYVTETVANCESSASVVTIVVNPTPVAPVAGTNATYCQGDVIADLTATAGSAGSLTWYDDMALTTVVGTGATFTPSSAVGTHTYYVTETLGSCESDATEVTIIVNPTPSFTIGTTQHPTTCGGTEGFITLTGLNASSSYVVTYTDNSGLVNLGTITTDASGEYVITGLGADTYSNITVTLGSCSSVEGPVILSDPNAPTFTLSSTNPTTCGGTDGTITIEGLDATTTYDISYNNGSGVVNLPGVTTDAAGNYVITGLAQGSYTDFTVTLAGCIGTNAGPVVLTDPSAPAAPLAGTNATYCEGDVIADLTATAGSGGTLTWYDNVTLTDVVGTGATFTPSSAVGTHTYYVTETVANCESSASVVTIVVNPTPVAPVAGTNATYCQGDVIADLTATAGSAGSLTWYDDMALTTVVGTGATFTPSSAVGTHTYYVTETLGSCESDATEVTIIVNPTPSFTIGTTQHPTTCGGTEGFITLTGLNASSSYVVTYTDNSGLVNLGTITTDASGEYVITGLGADTYSNITVTLGSCSSVEGPVILSDPNAPTFTLSSTNPTTCGGTDGTITIEGLDATTTYDISYNNGSGVVNLPGVTTDAAGNYVITGLAQGSYTDFTVTLAGCIGTNAGPVVLTDPSAPAAPLAGTNATYCEGDVIADLTATAGSGGTLTWYDNVTLTDVVGTGATFTPSSAVGTHTYYVTETVANCESSASVVTIVVNPTPVAPVAGTNATYCQGDVIADLTATAGSAGSLTWYDDMALTTVVGTGATFTPSSAVGTHTYYVTETLGSCESDATEVTIIVNPTPSFTIGTTQHPTTCGGTEGFITLTGLNASSSYVVTYTDNSGLVNLGTITTDASGEYVITGLGADTYSNITVTLGSCSSVEGPVILSDPNAPTFTLSSTNPTTCGGTDGTITIEGLDATTTYDISYNNGSGVVNLPGVTTDAAGNYVITGLAQGSYTDFTVTLAGCIGTNAGPVVLTDPSAPAAPLAGTNATYCQGDAIANLTATAGSGGTLTWYDNVGLTDVVGTGATFTPSSAVGTHTYYVTETVANCESSASVVTIIVNPTPVAPVAGPDGLYCEGETVLDISATSGSGGTINWYSDAALTSQAGTGNTFSPDNTVGVHTYYATELLGNCESDATEVIIVVNPTPTFSIEQETNPTECGSSDGSFTIIGLDPTSSYQVTYNSGATTIDLGTITPNANGSITVGNLAAGTYTDITVSLGLCSFQGGPVILVSPGTPDAPQVSGAATYCEGQAIAPLTASTSSGGTLTWYSDAELNNAINTGTSFNPDSTPGTTTYYVTETADGCESGATMVTVQINPTPAAPTVTGQGEFCNDEEVTLTAQAGSGTISWYTDAELTNLIQTGSSLSVSQNPGSYTYYVVASIGNCISNSVQATALIIDCDTLQLEIPTAFTPNFDGVNDTWEIPGLKEKYPNNRVLVYNRWGNLIFESEGYDTPWDGTYNGEPLPVGSYFFIIDFNDGVKEQERGTVTIVKKN